MPIPKPHKGESQDDFVSRCMGDETMKNDYDDNKQRLAVCFSSWRDTHGGAKEMIEPEDYDNEDDFMADCTSEFSEEVCQLLWDERAAKKVVHKTHVSSESGMEFVLSDETPDRLGDVISVSGWDLTNFKKNPVALFGHRSDFPIGTWSNLRAKDGALRGHLKMAPEGTSPRIDEIRKLIDAGILKAVSVGFRPVEHQPRRTKNGDSVDGYLYTKSELVEVSVVSVPANPNALSVAKSLKVSDATIDLVFAKHGKGDQVVKRQHSGEHAKSHSNKGKPMSTLAERIKAAQNEVLTLQDNLTKHLENDDDGSETASTITEEMNGQIEVKQKHLESLQRAEKALMTKMVVARVPVEEERPELAVVVSNPRPFALPAKKLQPIDYLWRGLTVMVKHHLGGRQDSVIGVLQKTYGEDEPTRVVMERTITKAAALPATTTGSGWADTLVQTMFGQFVEALIPYSVYPRLAALGSSFTFGQNGIISLPTRTSGNLSGAFVAQGAPIPVKAGVFTATTLTPKKMGVITTMTREIRDHSTPAIEGILRQAILEDTGVAIDTVLLDNTAADTTRPAGLRNLAGAAQAATAGGGIAAIIGDLKLLVNDLVTNTKGNLRRPVWIINPGDVLALSLTQAAAGGDLPFRDELARGTLLGYPVIQAFTGTSDMMFLIDAADFITASGDSPEFMVSDQAVLHMEDTNPAALSAVGTPNAVAAPIRSLFQTDTMAIRMILPLNWALRHPDVVSWTQTMTWN